MKKHTLITVLCLLISTIAIAGDLSFKATEHNFGKVEYKSRTTATFHYTNNSKQPIVIVESKSACNCTKVEYSKKPIKPGESGTVSVIFTAKSEGAFFKSIDIVTQKGSERLTLKGVVVK